MDPVESKIPNLPGVRGVKTDLDSRTVPGVSSCIQPEGPYASLPYIPSSVTGTINGCSLSTDTCTLLLYILSFFGRQRSAVPGDFQHQRKCARTSCPDGISLANIGTHPCARTFSGKPNYLTSTSRVYITPEYVPLLQEHGNHSGRNTKTNLTRECQPHTYPFVASWCSRLC